LCVTTNHVGQQQPQQQLWWGEHALFPPSPFAPSQSEVPHAHLKSIWECPKINEVGVELENGKIQAGWRC
jgi:hypothetical protein